MLKKARKYDVAVIRLNGYYNLNEKYNELSGKHIDTSPNSGPKCRSKILEFLRCMFPKGAVHLLQDGDLFGGINNLPNNPAKMDQKIAAIENLYQYTTHNKQIVKHDNISPESFRGSDVHFVKSGNGVNNLESFISSLFKMEPDHFKKDGLSYKEIKKNILSERSK